MEKLTFLELMGKNENDTMIVDMDLNNNILNSSINQYSINGSFIMESGTIVLDEEDIESYFNGVLIFYEKDKNQLIE